MADAIGIDPGSYKTVLACVKQRGIEIVLSETSSKWTPTTAGYTAQERLVGDAAINQMKKNFKNTLQFFGRFMGLNQDCLKQLEEERKFTTYKHVEMENKKVGFEITIRGEKHIFSPEQIMGFYLRKVKTYFEKAGMNSKEIVISIPNYASNSERQAYLDAADIAGINCVRLINEGTATALTYGFFRKADLDSEKERIVAFVDFGHSKLSVTYASFVKAKMKILGTYSNKNLGARQIDFQLFELLGGEFAKKYGCDPRENVRCRLRLLDSIEKVRKLLTSNKEADVHCESLMEDEDLHRNIKRDDLEDLIKPFILDFRACLDESIAKIGLSQDEIHSIELVGEATRIPCCIAQIEEAFGKQPSRTLNSTDCIARGCALQAAMLSPNFQVANFQVEEYNLEPISISYKFKGTEKVVTKELFKAGSSFPSTKTITFDNKQGNLDLIVHYSDKANLMEGLPTQVSQYDIAEGKKDEKTEKCSFAMRVSNNIHNVACLDEVEFIQEWTEEEKIPIKASPVPTVPTPPPKNEEQKKEQSQGDGEEEKKKGKSEEPTVPEAPQQPEQQFEIKKRSKKNFGQIKFNTQSFALAPNTKTMFYNLENQLTEGDYDILEMKQLRNDLEAYSYELRNNLDSYGPWEKYLEEDSKGKLIAEINQVVDWIYGDGENAPKNEYKDKLEKFKLIGEPVKNRHFYYGELDVYYPQFDKIVEIVKSKLNTIDYLTDSQKEIVNKKLEDAIQFIKAVKADKDGKQLYDNPVYTCDQIIGTMNSLKKDTEAIFNLPPPKQKTPEKLAEDKKQDETGEEPIIPNPDDVKESLNKDVEMQNDEQTV